MNLGKAIKTCRVQKEMTQGELAIKSKISVSYLSLIEKGKREPNFAILEKISRELDIPVSIIVFLASDKNELLNLNDQLIDKLSNTTIALMKIPKNGTA